MSPTTIGRNLQTAVDAYLRDCFRLHTPPHVAELARRLGVTRLTLGKHFQAITGIHLGAYFKQEQIACAKRLLRSTNWKVATIARHAAFTSERSFIRAFVRTTGITPTAFRRSLCR